MAGGADAVEADWAPRFATASHDFIEAILAGRQSPLDLAEARATLAFALATQRSAQERREVRIDELG